MLKIPDLHSWINYLPGDVRQAVLARMQPRRYTDGEAVYCVGEPGDACYFIEAGKVRICNYTADGKEFQMVELVSEECCGEIAMIDDLPRFNSAYAVGDTLLRVLPKPAFRRLYEEHGAIARALNVFFAHRFRSLYMSAADANMLTLKQRLIRTIAMLGYNGRVEDGRRVIDEVSHQALALTLGATRQGVSRELKALEKEGLIELRYGKIVVVDIDELLRRCEHLVSGDLVVAKRSHTGPSNELS